MARRKYYTNGYSLSVYSTGKEFYVRLQNSETPELPHGIALGAKFDKEENANDFLDMAEKYLGFIEEPIVKTMREVGFEGNPYEKFRSSK